MTHTPHGIAVIVEWRTDRRGVTSVIVLCPFGRHRHIHGLADGVITAHEHRAAHCGGPGGYYLVDPLETAS